MHLIDVDFIHYFSDNCHSFSSSLGFRRRFQRVENTENSQAISANERMARSNEDQNQTTSNALPDYREEYIRSGNDDNDEQQQQQEDNQSLFNNEERPFVPENCFTCISISDFELNPMNVTTTSFLSPSTNSLPNNDVQYIQETSRKTETTTLKPPIGSVLVRAY